MPGPEEVRLNHVEQGDGLAVVLLHQTPRSVDEYRDVVPALAARGYRALAFDTPGFGDSPAVAGEPSIEAWAAAIGGAIEGLGIDRFALVGHHTGGVIAVELASRRPERIAALVLSSAPLTDAEYHATAVDESSVDQGEDAESLRASRAGFYPADKPELLDRYVADALRAGPAMARRGHHIVAAYQMDVSALTMPVLLLGADADPYAFPQLERMAAALPHAETAVIAGGMVPLPDGWPEEFTGAVAGFLDRVL